jgi:hypothetical protein
MTEVQIAKIFDPKILEGIAPGTWVAIASDQESVVATGESLDAAIERAREKGVAHPFMFRIPVDDSALILWHNFGPLPL